MAILPGTRLRDNGVFGTITDNPLTAGATTFNSADLARLGVVSGNHAIVTLDPLRQFGDPEIVMVTAHSASATVATIQRGMFGSVARSHPQNTLWVHAATNDDFIRVVTSGTRPTDSYRGQTIYESDTNRFIGFSSSSVWQQNGLFFDPPACRIFHNANQPILHNTITTLAFNSERYDTDNMHDTVTFNSRITIKTAGLYDVKFNGGFVSAAGNSTRLFNILLNGTTIIGRVQIDGATGTQTFVVSTMYKFALNDFIEVQAYHFQGGTVDVAAASNYTPEFMATWIGRGN